MSPFFTVLFSLICLFCEGALAGPAAQPEIRISEGTYSPFFRDKDEIDQKIGPLMIDRYPVTNQQFQMFLKDHPEWRKSSVRKIFADGGYLNHWTSDFKFKADMTDKPVTNISWFAARQYCESQNKRLLTTSEWEYASRAQDREVLTLILDWYSRTNEGLRKVQQAPVNSFGLVGMHGLIWEWVEDFSSAIMSGDSRSSNETSRDMFCGSGSLKAKDPSQYATFMRFAYRSSLKASSTGRSLGFRCARSVEKEGPNEKK